MGASASANSVVNIPVINKKKSESIDQFLLHEKLKETKSVKLLLLGRPESGKSTLARQIRIIHDRDFMETERLAYRSVLRQNLIDILKTLLQTIDQLNIQTGTEYHNLYDELSEIPSGTGEYLVARRHTIKQFLASAAFHQCMVRRWEYNLQSSAKYLLDGVDRLLDPGYVPSTQDILRARVDNNGLHETSFKFKGLEFRMVDVGGQRSDPRKWIHYFDNVSALIYTVDISRYDQQRDDDGIIGEQNELLESLALFKKVVSHRVFSDTTSILFLNKTDLFKQKIQHVPLKCCFPEYKGADEYKEASIFVQWKFKQSITDNKEMYSHFTTATDTSNIQTVFDSVIAIILKCSQNSAVLY
ncbi:hypothetical protein SNE40_001472 [Patella caerulea]|uniref:Uncharacterized protein n=1 Tax=Patella caerulea TaxID=87958 RepID=A0AAN8KN73_PATCE